MSRVDDFNRLNEAIMSLVGFQDLLRALGITIATSDHDGDGAFLEIVRDGAVIFRVENGV